MHNFQDFSKKTGLLLSIRVSFSNFQRNGRQIILKCECNKLPHVGEKLSRDVFFVSRNSSTTWLNIHTVRTLRTQSYIMYIQGDAKMLIKTKYYTLCFRDNRIKQWKILNILDMLRIFLNPFEQPKFSRRDWYQGGNRRVVWPFWLLLLRCDHIMLSWKTSCHF